MPAGRPQDPRLQTANFYLTKINSWYGLWRIGDSHLEVVPVLEKDEEDRQQLYREIFKLPVCFNVPRLNFSTYHKGKLYSVWTVIHGEPLSILWPSAKDEMMRNRIADQVASALWKLAQHHSDKISTIHGQTLDPRLNTLGISFTLGKDIAERQLAMSRMCGFDGSKFVLSMMDISPENLLLDEEGTLLGFEQWASACYVPEDWILTRFLNLPTIQTDSRWSAEDRRDWVARLHEAMLRYGFKDRGSTGPLWKHTGLGGFR